MTTTGGPSTDRLRRIVCTLFSVPGSFRASSAKEKEKCVDLRKICAWVKAATYPSIAL